MVTVNLSELDSYTAYIVSGFHCEDTLTQRLSRYMLQLWAEEKVTMLVQTTEPFIILLSA